MFLVMDLKLFKNSVKLGHYADEGLACQILLIGHFAKYLMCPRLGELHQLLSGPTLLLKPKRRKGNPNSFAKDRKMTISIVIAGLFLPSGQQLATTISSTRSRPLEY